jgi:hypothetical protein
MVVPHSCRKHENLRQEVPRRPDLSLRCEWGNAPLQLRAQVSSRVGEAVNQEFQILALRNAGNLYLISDRSPGVGCQALNELRQRASPYRGVRNPGWRGAHATVVRSTENPPGEVLRFSVGKCFPVAKDNNQQSPCSHFGTKFESSCTTVTYCRIVFTCQYGETQQHHLSN